MKHGPLVARSLDQLRVAHVSPAHFSGASLIGAGERYVSYVARAIEAARSTLPFDLVQVVFAIGAEDFAFSDNGVAFRVFANENPSPHPMSAVSKRLWAALNDFDVLHVHQGLTFFGCFCAVIARSLKKTLIITDLGGGENSLLLQHGGLHLADGIISVSEFAKSLVSTHFAGPHVAILGPVDTAYFAPGDSIDRRREVLCVGQFLPHNGFDRVIDALPADLPLRIVGRPHDPDYYALLQKRSEGHNVTFVTDADDVGLLDCYRSAGLYVHASTFLDCYVRHFRKPELLIGLTTFEAMATGLPVVVANTASLPELAQHRSFSQVFDDLPALRRILNEYACGVWPTPDAGSAARRHAVQHFGFPVVGHRIAEFYAKVHAGRIGAAMLS
jgi:glycosyltransferase involved in cell wall biosynthesis